MPVLKALVLLIALFIFVDPSVAQQCSTPATGVDYSDTDIDGVQMVDSGDSHLINVPHAICPPNPQLLPVARSAHNWPRVPAMCTSQPTKYVCGRFRALRQDNMPIRTSFQQVRGFSPRNAHVGTVTPRRHSGDLTRLSSFAIHAVAIAPSTVAYVQCAKWSDSEGTYRCTARPKGHYYAYVRVVLDMEPFPPIPNPALLPQPTRVPLLQRLWRNAPALSSTTERGARHTNRVDLLHGCKRARIQDVRSCCLCLVIYHTLCLLQICRQLGDNVDSPDHQGEAVHSHVGRLLIGCHAGLVVQNMNIKHGQFRKHGCNQKCAESMTGGKTCLSNSRRPSS